MAMTKKIVWLVISCLMIISLVVASCGPATVEEEEEEEEVIIGEEEEEEEEEEVKEEELLPPEVPKYGGVHTKVITQDPMGFDEAYAVHPNITTAFLTNSELMGGDWAKGPAGTNDTSWVNGFIGRVDLETGYLAESWEIMDEETIVYHLRKGVHWHNKAPVNGRELTADDVVYSINRNFTTPTAYLFGAYTRNGYNPTSIKALDKYTVEVKVPQTMLGLMVLVCGDFQWAWPKEMIDLYGDMKDWKNSCGTGPYMLTDYVSGSSLTFKKNPDYFMHDPLHPENQLPYLNGVKELIISDKSTRLAALRTGKVDALEEMVAVEFEDAELLMKQCPDLKYAVDYGIRSVAFRLDNPELPFTDIRVRRALSLAVNQEEILETLYQGHGAVYSYPYLPLPEYEPFRVPFDELPESAREPYTYNPEKAKQLLAEAGYPSGFKTKVVCGDSTAADFLSVIKAYFAAINVDMEIEQLERGTFTSLSRGRKHEEGIIRGSLMTQFPFRLLEWRKESFDDHSFFDSETIRAAYEEISAKVGIDDARVAEILKGLVPYMLEQNIQIWCPAYEIYNTWWPWMQNYHGESTMGYFNPHQHIHYIWVDEALKKSMGY